MQGKCTHAAAKLIILQWNYTLNNISWVHDPMIGNFSSYYYSKLLVQ